jgi:hypothetical protein
LYECPPLLGARYRRGAEVQKGNSGDLRRLLRVGGERRSEEHRTGTSEEGTTV